MADNDDSKTEQPTQRKLTNARDEGNVSQSLELKTAAMLMAALVMIWGMAPFLLKRLAIIMGSFLGRSYQMRVDTPQNLHYWLGSLLAEVGLIMALPLAMFIIVGLSIGIAQAGWVISFQKIAPDFDRINPLSGFGRLFSGRSVVELVKNIAKLAVVGVVCYAVISPQMQEWQRLPMLEPSAILAYVGEMLRRLLFAVVLIMIVIAGADWFYQRFSFNKKMRMTKQELKDEQKQTEGDPAIKARLRSLRMQRARQRMMAAVPKADVVVTNPTHYACALKYDPDTMAAPVLVAKGVELIAIRIRQIAQENGVPIVENPPLARALYATVELDREIPPEHYKTVAEVISYVFKLKGRIRK
jgi:flagellar biosynthetic protein FlhB